MSSELNLERRVVCAAIRHKDVIICAPRHFDDTMRNQLNTLALQHYVDLHLYEKGFVNTWGEFLTRRQAWLVAVANNQIIRRVGGDDTNGGTLYSENLY